MIGRALLFLAAVMAMIAPLSAAIAAGQPLSVGVASTKHIVMGNGCHSKNEHPPRLPIDVCCVVGCMTEASPALSSLPTALVATSAHRASTATCLVSYCEGLDPPPPRFV